MKAGSFYRADKELLAAIAKEIKRLRKAKKLTIEDLSEICGLHSKYLQTIERNYRNMSISVFVQLAKSLEISPPKLLEKALKTK